MRLPILEAAQGQTMDQGAGPSPDGDRLDPPASGRHDDCRPTAGGRAGVARLSMVLAGNARAGRMAPGRSGHPQARRDHGADVAHGIRPPGTERGGTGDRSGGRGVGLRRRPRRGRRGRAGPRLGGDAHDGGVRNGRLVRPTEPTGRRSEDNYQWEARKRTPSPVFWQRITALHRECGAGGQWRRSPTTRRRNECGS